MLRRSFASGQLALRERIKIAATAEAATAPAMNFLIAMKLPSLSVDL
jgi:hypothetical protein